jgi:DNA topoisomerase-1
VGYKISPLLWKKVRKGLSAGRVQSVATRLICDREEEIDSFVPEEYWSLIAKLLPQKSKKTFEAKFFGSGNEKIELKTGEQVERIVKELEGKKFKVQKIKKSEKKKAPSPPFTTSTLQQEAARRYGFPTRKTMLVAQQLYEGIDVKGVGAVGLVTYIRTDSTRISAEAQSEARRLITGKYGEDYLPDETRVYKNKSASQDAHEAIRPTNISMEPGKIKGSLSSDQYKLYRLIWERFVASQMGAAVYDTVSVDIKAADYLFKANGSKLKFQGYMVAYVEAKDDDPEEGEGVIPELTEGQELELKELVPKQHFTQPPQRYTEATLVKALEEKGIGRPSTYAPIITTIQQRGYVLKEKKFLAPTELGKIVTEIMKNFFKDIVDVQFTAQMEKKLDDVEEGDKNWVEVMENFYSQFIDVLKDAESKIGNVEIPDEVTDVACEKCGRNMVIKNGRFGRFMACPGFPECRNTKPIIEEAGVKCPKCGEKVLVKKTRKGRKYYGCEKNPECGFMTWDKPTGESCPKCSSFLVTKFIGRKVRVKCSGENCDYVKGV